jgi:hypothetical protein
MTISSMTMTRTTTGGSTTSMRWWGVHCNLTSVGVFNPMSAPQYAWTELADTMWPDHTATAAMAATAAAQWRPHPPSRLVPSSAAGLTSLSFVPSSARSSSSTSSTSSTPSHARQCLTDNSEAKRSEHSSAATSDLPTAVGLVRIMTSGRYQCC